ncbi:MAG: zinc metalloprotease HtpX [Candidatus Bathyarchaeota archaeon]|nr:zinc metalloprotease HtpX [Candidatus Bathyarchaeota archaeon]
MNVWKLRASMAGTLAAIIGLSTLFLAVVLTLAGAFDLITLFVIVVAFNVIQWLISPYLINALYRAKEVKPEENPQLHQMIEKLSIKSGIKKPKLMLAQVPIPNAMAYGSPLTGKHVAVTSGLLNALQPDEVEAVIGHELGHLKHRDVQIMMFVSLLPALFYYIGYSLTISSMYGRRRDEGGNAALLGMVFMAFWWVLNLFTLYLSRLREYFADKHSASIVENGSSKLSLGLAKIVNTTRNMRRTGRQPQNLNAFKALFIADPDKAEIDAAELSRASATSNEQRMVQEILSQKLTTAHKIGELFSTHPNIVKRLRALQETS